MEYLHRNKKLYSVLLFIVSIAVFIPVAINLSTVGVIIGIIMLAVHFVISLVYYIKGLPHALYCITYYLIYLVAVTAGVIGSLCIKLPGFLSKGVFNSFAIVLALFFTMILNVPKRVKEKSEHRIFNLREKKKETLKIKKELNVILGIALCIVGVIGLLISRNASDNSTYFLNSWVFWTILFSVTLLVTGFVLILGGYLRSLLAFAICGALIVIGLYVYKYSIHLYSISIPLLIVFLTAALVIIYFSLFYLFRRLAIKQSKCFIYFEKNKMLYGVNITHKDMLPLDGYTTLLITTIHVETQIGTKTVDRFIDRFQLFMKNHSVLFVGTVLDANNKEILLYTYTQDKKGEDFVRKYLSKNLTYEYSIHTVSDDNWSVYLEELYPDAFTIARMHIESLVDSLTKGKFDLTKRYPIVIGVLFSDYDNAIDFKNKYTETIYIIRKLVYLEEQESYFYNVLIQKETLLDIEILNDMSEKIITLARSLDGEYQGFELGVVDVSNPDIIDK